MSNVVLIGPRSADSWIAIEELMKTNPMRWFSLVELVDAGRGHDIQDKTIENMVRKAARDGVLKSAGRKGNKSYRLADHYTVAIVLSHRKA